MNNDDKTKAIIEHAEAIRELVDSGYAGVDETGKIVDRREHPKALPIQKNTLLGVPEPRRVEETDEP